MQDEDNSLSAKEMDVMVTSVPNIKAYSYRRWSSDPQTFGDSDKRQLEATRDICNQRGWELDETLKPDKGVSAYTGSNLEHGSLAQFLQRVESGRIKTPCV